MKKFMCFTVFLFFFSLLKAQKVDSIYFHLYTDSLKKGVYNYINIDAQLKNGRWLPLDSKQIEFSSNAGEWDGNSIILPVDFKEDSVCISAHFRENDALSKSITVYIKKGPETIRVKTEQEIMDEIKKNQ